ncbi:dTMP kinase [Pelagibacterales bacterium SAG-MED29]|nr:dTMP kinase [Pelagibacterales bacterium SAG-MED29]
MFKKKPFFVVFEGVEGCGKSYQSQKLKKNLEKKGVNLVLTREPGGTRIAESIRRLILIDYFNRGKKENFDKYTDTLLYLAARNEHIKNKIKPALQKKKVVICDRFTDSTLAYQVYGKKVNRNFIDHIHKFILQGIKPNITFILKVSSKSSKLRLKKRRTKNRYDKFSQSFYTKAQRSFLQLARNKKNYFILNSSSNNSDLEKKIFKIVCKYLKIK